MFPKIKAIFVLFFLVFSVQNTSAAPAPFFGTDSAAGETAFRNAVTAATSSAEFFEYHITSSKATTDLPFAVSGSNGSTIYVNVTRGSGSTGSQTQQAFTVSKSHSHDGNSTYYFANSSVSVSSWAEVINEGIRFEFYTDAAMTTKASLNAFATFTNDWGTCCTTNNYTPDGRADGTSVYAVFETPAGTQSLNKIGTITSSISSDTHFVAEIDDSNSFSAVTIAPNGQGEAFYTGGYLLFSQVDEGSVATGTGWTPSVPPSATISPANGATGVSISSTITITFSEAVRKTDASALTNDNVDSLITLKDTNSSGTDISFDATINDDKTVITITPTSDFSASQQVYVSIGATVEDNDGNNLSATSSTFTAAAAGTPSGSITPANGSSGVALNSTITITYSEAMRIISGDTELTDTNVDALITLKKLNSSGIDIAFDATVSSDKTTITITPTASFNTNQVVYVAIGNTLEDLSNNAASGLSSSFTTTSVSDSTPPTITITSSDVTDGDSSNDATISLTFTSSESTSDFLITDVSVSNGTLSGFSGSGTTYTATLTPLTPGEVTVDIASGAFTDAASNGNTAATQFNWYYGTDPTQSKNIVGFIKSWMNTSSGWSATVGKATDNRMEWIENKSSPGKTSHQGIRFSFKNKYVDRVINSEPEATASLVNIKKPSTDYLAPYAIPRSLNLSGPNNDSGGFIARGRIRQGTFFELRPEERNNPGATETYAIYGQGGKSASYKPASEFFDEYTLRHIPSSEFASLGSILSSQIASNSGDAEAIAVSLMTNTAAALRENILGNLNPSFGTIAGDWSLWTEGEIRIGSIDETSSASELSTNSQSITVGIDTPIDNGLFGLAVSVGKSEVDVEGTETQVNSDNYALSAYTSQILANDLNLKASGGVGKIKFKTKRTSGNTTLVGNRDAHQIFAQASISNGSFDINDLEITPYGKTSLSYTSLDSFTESGGNLALHYDKQNIRSYMLFIGSDASHKTKYANGKLISFGKIEYGLDLTRDSDISISYLDSNTTYNTSIGKVASSNILLRLGSEFESKEGIRSSIAYEHTEALGAGSSNAINMQVAIPFE